VNNRLEILEARLRSEQGLPPLEYCRLAIEVAYILATIDSTKAGEYAHEALQQARSGRDEILELESSLVIAVIAVESAGFDDALPRLFQITKQAELLHLSALQAASLRWTGISYLRIAMFTTALEYFAKAKIIAETKGLDIELAKIIKASGDAYFGLGEIATALQHYRESMRLLEGTDEGSERAAALMSIANAHKAQSGFNQARIFFEQALAAYKHAGNTPGVRQALIGVAEMYAEQNRFDMALELLFATIDISGNDASLLEKAQAYFAIGEVYCKADRTDKALDYLLRAEKSLVDTQALALQAKVYELLTKCYKAKGDTERAFSNLERFHALREQTAIQDGKRAIQYLQQGFASEQAQKEAEIYRLKNVELAQVQQELEGLLVNMLPVPIAQRLRAGENYIADAFENVTVVFVDIVGFTRLAGEYSAQEIVKVLDHIFTIFDGITVKYGLEKIKTIGDAYMIASGIPYPRRDHAEAAALAALEMLDAIQIISFRLSEEGFTGDINVRIGMHTGSVVAGVIGKKKFTYDLWGDTVNTASRMESHGEAGRIHVSEDVNRALNSHWSFATGIGESDWSLVISHLSSDNKLRQLPNDQSTNDQSTNDQSLSRTSQRFLFEERGEIDVKGKGRMKTYFLLGKKT